jgi:GNAT superfamily N-acetyltransferase
MINSFRVRKATLRDFRALYDLGNKTKELQVTKGEPFLDQDQFKWYIRDPKGFFILAEDTKILGFIYASFEDQELPYKHKYSCLMYIVVHPSARGKGVADALFEMYQREAKKRGFTHIYSLANDDSPSVQRFYQKRGLKKGKKFIWMDKKL